MHVIADISHHLPGTVAMLIHGDPAKGCRHLPSSTELHHDKRTCGENSYWNVNDDLALLFKKMYHLYTLQIL